MKDILFWLRRFVMVYGIIMICTFFMCLFFNPTSELLVVSFFGRIIVFTLLGMVTLIVYHSKEELSPRAWWCRTILHLVVLEAVYLPLAHHWHFWYGKLDAVIYASFILAAKILWHLIDYGISARTVSEINEKIRKRRREQSKIVVG
ncbi:MAG: hypothetical protein MR016_08715 [Agathobacter sp.]|nr:hypothetical protein [Agathobacter sp.]